MENERITLKTKLILAVNLAAIISLLIFSAVNAGRMDSCETEPVLLWEIPDHPICGGGIYRLYACFDEEKSFTFVSACTSGIKSTDDFIFLPVITKQDTILGTPPIW